MKSTKNICCLRQVLNCIGLKTLTDMAQWFPTEQWKKAEWPMTLNLILVDLEYEGIGEGQGTMPGRQ